MAKAFGGFVHTSPLSSLAHDPLTTLASNCIRDYFGPSVQTVADCLMLLGGEATLQQVLSKIRQECRRELNQERARLVEGKLHKSKGPETSGYIVEGPHIRACLLVLVHHSIVHIRLKKNTFIYKISITRARWLPRYPRYVEHTRKIFGDNAATILEEIAVQGRMRTEDVLAASIASVQRHDKTELTELREEMIKTFKKMVEEGYLEMAPGIEDLSEGEEEEEGEFEESGNKRKIANGNGSSKKKRKVDDSVSSSDAPALVALLQKPAYTRTFPPGTVWRVNASMFHDALRAFALARLTAERHQDKVQIAGSVLSAALKFWAHQEHVQKQVADKFMFTPKDILDYLPHPIITMLTNRPGGVQNNLSKTLVSMAKLDWPTVVLEVEDAQGHSDGGRFEVMVRQLLDHLKRRILHKMLVDSHGEIAARICSILEAKGHLEADTVAKAAMVPAKDVREILHRLYRANYVCLLNMQQTKQHNPSNAIYLWSYEKSRIYQTAMDNVCKALYNVRLRRQHELEVGKEWIERAKEAGEIDENDHDIDKVNYDKFCRGLERLDDAVIQLDETLMVLSDF